MENKDLDLYDLFQRYSYSQLKELFKKAKTKQKATSKIRSAHKNADRIFYLSVSSFSDSFTICIKVANF